MLLPRSGIRAYIGFSISKFTFSTTSDLPPNAQSLPSRQSPSRNLHNPRRWYFFKACDTVTSETSRVEGALLFHALPIKQAFDYPLFIFCPTRHQHALDPIQSLWVVRYEYTGYDNNISWSLVFPYPGLCPLPLDSLLEWRKAKVLISSTQRCIS